MDTVRLEQMQALMRLERRQPQAKSEVGQPVSDLMTTEETCAYLRISKSQLYVQTRSDTRSRQVHPLPVIRFGKSLKFRKSSLDAWMSSLEKQAR
jgi:predicted DNA-binding transcriptional regulator AlpA